MREPGGDRIGRGLETSDGLLRLSPSTSPSKCLGMLAHLTGLWSAEPGLESIPRIVQRPKLVVGCTKKEAAGMLGRGKEGLDVSEMQVLGEGERTKDLC